MSFSNIQQYLRNSDSCFVSVNVPMPFSFLLCLGDVLSSGSFSQKDICPSSSGRVLQALCACFVTTASIPFVQINGKFEKTEQQRL